MDTVAAYVGARVVTGDNELDEAVIKGRLKEEVQELMDSTALYWTTGVGHGVNENYRSGSILHLDRDSIIGGSNSVPFIFHIGGFWTSTFEDGYPVAYDVIADETNDRFVTAGHMELVTGKGGEYARHIRAVWDPNM